MALDLCELQAELNVVNAELFFLRQHNEELLAESHRPLRTIIAERVGLNLRVTALMASGLAGIAVGQVKRVKLPRLRVDWQ